MTYLEAEDVYRKAREMAFEGFVSPLDSLPDDIQDVEGYCHPQPANNLRFQLRLFEGAIGETAKITAARYLAWLVNVIETHLASEAA